MSILLEALRKSEKNQKVREAPTIHSDDRSESASEPLQTGPLALLLIVALFLSGWFVWRQYQPPAGSNQAPVTLGADESQAVSEPVVTDKQVGQVAPSKPVVKNSGGQSRTPVESYQPPEDSTTLTTTGVQKPAKRNTRDKAAGKSANKPVKKPVKKAVRPKQKAGAGLPGSAPKPAVNKKPVETKPEKYHPGDPAPIGYWDLPDAIRSDVPEIKFSVLVFAADPADRFVLINGQRLVEGDSAQPGLVVEEIQRDGVLFSFRVYRFLVKK